MLGQVGPKFSKPKSDPENRLSLILRSDLDPRVSKNDLDRIYTGRVTDQPDPFLVLAINQACPK